MVTSGQDGFAVSLLLGKLQAAAGDEASARTALERASRFDPLSATPFYLLAELGRKRGDVDAELSALRRLSQLEQHENKVYRRLLEILVEKKAWEEIVKLGDAAVYADMEGFQTHRAFAEALAQTGDKKRAVFELESATLSPAKPQDLSEAHTRLAELYSSVGRARDAAKSRKRAQELTATAPN